MTAVIANRRAAHPRPSARLSSFLRQFHQDHSGAVLVPFALWMPVFLLIIISSIEVGVLNLRQFRLDRALADTVRDIKIGADITTHEEIKASICEKSSILEGCVQRLKLEMIGLDLRNWSAPPSTADCVDVAQEVNPLRNFQNGTGGQMMMLRACFKYEATTPIGSFNSMLTSDTNGFTALVSTMAFVHEPN